MSSDSLSAVVTDAAARLREAGVPSPTVDAEHLLAHVLGTDRSDLARRRAMGEVVDQARRAALDSLVSERRGRVPLQHLTGQAHLRRSTVDVGPGVFVPRPETEVTVQHALEAVLAAAGTGRADEPVHVVDLCAGSGVISVCLSEEAAEADVDIDVVAVEISPDAAHWARGNAERYGLGRVAVRVGDVASACLDLAGRVDVVVANPPYIPDDAIPRDVEAREHDPALALYGGPDGLDVVRDVATCAARLLRPGGTVVVEHGEQQGPDVADVMRGAGLAGAATHPDLTGRPRVTVARRDGGTSGAPAQRGD